MTKKLLPILLLVMISNSLALPVYADELPPTLTDLSTTSSGTTASSTTSTTPAATSTTSTATSDNTATPTVTSVNATTTSATTSTPTATSPSFQDFTDVPVNHPNYNAIIVLRYQGVISGYPDNTFHPEQPLNRVEALKLIFETAKINMTQGIAVANFQDTKADAWYSGYLNRAVFLEIANGYPDATFKPEKSVNLVEFLKMLELAQKVDLSKTTLNQIPYADALPGQWYSKYINYAKINNLLTADADNKVYPASPVTRAQAAEIIYRFRNMLNQPKPDTSTGSTSTSTSTTPSTPASLQENMALYVSTGYKFAIQYPKKWFYSALDNAAGSSAIHTYGFGDKDLSTNAPIVTLELLANDENFAPLLTDKGYLYSKETSTAGQVMLSTKINNSNRIYRLSGPANQEEVMLAMLTTLTANIDGLSSYNPAEKTGDTTTTTNTTTANTTTSTTPAN